jgi:hypothetical protein
VFKAITVDIPSGSLSDELSTNEMGFSKRGGMLIDGHKVSGPVFSNGNAAAATSRRAKAAAKMLSTDEETLSQKVRSFYEMGAELAQDADARSSLGRRIGPRVSSNIQF